jgi:hypothetical protein
LVFNTGFDQKEIKDLTMRLVCRTEAHSSVYIADGTKHFFNEEYPENLEKKMDLGPLRKSGQHIWKFTFHLPADAPANLNVQNDKGSLSARWYVKAKLLTKASVGTDTTRCEETLNVIRPQYMPKEVLTHSVKSDKKKRGELLLETTILNGLQGIYRGGKLRLRLKVVNNDTVPVDSARVLLEFNLMSFAHGIRTEQVVKRLFMKSLDTVVCPKPGETFDRELNVTLEDDKVKYISRMTQHNDPWGRIELLLVTSIGASGLFCKTQYSILVAGPAPEAFADVPPPPYISDGKGWKVADGDPGDPRLISEEHFWAPANFIADKGVTI